MSEQEKATSDSLTSRRWECRKCGACCKSPFTKFWLPELWDEKEGKCRHLKSDLCMVYDHRPDICQDIDFSRFPRGEEFRIIWCEFLDKHINKEVTKC